jgi:hypothetical protein
LFCSELIASKPRLIPNKGPKKLINTKKEGKVPSDIVNSLRNKNEFSGSLDFTTLLKFDKAVDIEPRQVNAIIINNIITLQLLT